MIDSGSLGRLFGGALFSGILLLSAAAAAQTTVPVYTLDDIADGVPRDINEAGDLAGWARIGTSVLPGVYTDATGVIALPLPTGASGGTAAALNDTRQAAGTLSDAGMDRAVRWSVDAITNIGRLLHLAGLGVGLNNEATGLNSFGDTVGSFNTGLSFFGVHGFLFTDADGVIDITPAFESAVANDINDAGQVAGTAESQMFRWSEAGGVELLGVPPGFAFSYGYAINEAGQVAGHTTSAGGNSESIIRFTDGIGLEILGGIGEVNVAYGINAHGDVVGEGRPTPGIVRAVLYIDGAGLMDINTLLDAAVNWRVLSAFDINDAREITGIAINLDTGDIHAVRLRPIGTQPPPPLASAK